MSLCFPTAGKLKTGSCGSLMLLFETNTPDLSDLKKKKKKSKLREQIPCHSSEWVGLRAKVGGARDHVGDTVPSF